MEQLLTKLIGTRKLLAQTQRHPRFPELSKKKADETILELRKILASKPRDEDLAKFTEAINDIAFADSDRASLMNLCIDGQLDAVQTATPASFSSSTSKKKQDCTSCVDFLTEEIYSDLAADRHDSLFKHLRKLGLCDPDETTEQVITFASEH